MTAPEIADVITQLGQERNAAEKRALDYECLFAYMCGRWPDVVPGLLHEAAESDDDWASATATALLAKLKR